MNQSLNLKFINTPQKMLLAVVVLLVSIFTSVKTFAQSVPEKVEVDINTDGGGGSVWYGQPWVWAIGIAIFIVIIIAITRSNKTNA